MSLNTSMALTHIKCNLYANKPLGSNMKWFTKDTETLEQILDDNYTLQHMGGYRQSKREWLNQIDDEQIRYFKTMPQKTTINIKGNTAHLICNTKLDARIYGMRHTWGMILEMHFEKRGDNWHPVNAKATSN